MGAIVAN